MLVVDVNILVAAFRADHPEHARVRSWWESLLASGEAFVVPDAVWIGFVRIVTSRRIFAVPATAAEALAFATALRAQPSYLPNPTPDPFEEFALLCREDQVAGNLVTDAWIAAVARALSASVATLDRDFRRFTGVALHGIP